MLPSEEIQILLNQRKQEIQKYIRNHDDKLDSYLADLSWLKKEYILVPPALDLENDKSTITKERIGNGEQRGHGVDPIGLYDCKNIRIPITGDFNFFQSFWVKRSQKPSYSYGRQFVDIREFIIVSDEETNRFIHSSLDSVQNLIQLLSEAAIKFNDELEAYIKEVIDKRKLEIAAADEQQKLDDARANSWKTKPQ